MFKKVNLKSKEELLKILQKEDFSRTTISFYRYVKIADPKAMIYQDDMGVQPHTCTDSYLEENSCT